MIRCFLIQPTHDVAVELMASWPECEQNPHGKHHQARAILYEGSEESVSALSLLRIPFRGTCEYCGQSSDVASDAAGVHKVYAHAETGERHRRLDDFPAGAMWFAEWYRRDDGLYGQDWDNQSDPPLIVKTPGGDWNIDSRATNCTMPEDRTHRCWIRHGQAPDITVDKNGVTCQAGAGSIQCGSFHGFLRNGFLVTA